MNATDSSALRIGAWRVDPALDEISKDGNTVKLERRAMQLLLCLAEHAGQVVSVEQLLDKVWAGVVVTPDSVYHAVAALRRMLGDNTKEPTYIANVPRRGYRLVAPVVPWIDPPHTPVENARRPAVERVSAILALPKLGSRWRRFATVLSIALVVALGYVVDKFWLSRNVASERPVTTLIPAAAPTQPAISEKSVAVLPFIDMSEKKDQEYLADGMAEEIINLLVKVPDLHVPARTSSFYFKGKSEDIPTIARRLLVTYVLEGSVRKFGDHLRISAQLVRADNGYHLWSETYDRDLHDVFKVQDEIANAVVQALQITLMGGPLTRQKGGTQDLEAYQLYLHAVSTRMQNTRSSLEAERGYLEQAIKLDPKFGLAWTELANNTLLAVINGIQLPVGTERARQQAQHALQLSPDLAEAHAVLQYIHCSYDWDWAAAEAEGREALALDPTSTGVLLFAGIFSATLGHWDTAEGQLRLALVRDPLATYPMFNLGSVLYRAGRFSDAAVSYRKLQEIAPDFSWTGAYAAKNMLAEGKPDGALAMVQQVPDEETRLEILSIVLQAAGRQAEADEALKALIGKYAESSAYYVAMTYAYRNDHDSALQWLEQAYRQKDSSLIEIVGEPLFKNMTHDPRYKAFLRKMNLPVLVT